MEQENIFDLKDLLKKTSINWDKDVNNEKVYWNKLRVIETRVEYPNLCFFKYDFEDKDFKKINLIEKGRKKMENTIHDIKLKRKFLCQKKVISCQYHDFFKTLSYDAKEPIQDSESDA